jgi:hypothetical protein
MIPPVSVSTTTFRYTLDALVVRSNDLSQVVALLDQAAASVGAPSRTSVDPMRMSMWHDLSHLARDVARVRDDIDGVIATIDPHESARSRIATGAPWPAVRSLSEWVITETPRVAAAARFEPMLETSRESDVAAPRNLVDRSLRIPTSDSPVRIDRFETPDGTRFEVYIAGTDFSAGPDDPWWAGSNTEFLRTGQSRSMSATENALHKAGVTGQTPIVITGHSQGGLIGLAIANLGRYTVDAVFTIGTPVGVVSDTEGVLTVHVAHPEDPVPALGGEARFATGTTWIVHPEPRTIGAEAHVAQNYVATSEAIVVLGDPELTALESRIRVTTEGVATWFRSASKN